MLGVKHDEGRSGRLQMVVPAGDGSQVEEVSITGEAAAHQLDRRRLLIAIGPLLSPLAVKSVDGVVEPPVQEDRQLAGSAQANPLRLPRRDILEQQPVLVHCVLCGKKLGSFPAHFSHILEELLEGFYTTRTSCT